MAKKSEIKKPEIKKIAILCSGGNAPGMANCVNTFVKKCLSLKIHPVAINNGFTGLHDNRVVELDPIVTQLYINNGSAMIGTSRCPEFVTSKEYREKCAKVLHKNHIDALIVVGGEGSMKGAYELSKLGVNVVVIPATIDNDVPCTSYTIGFDTCLNTICTAVEQINDVFLSHNGVAIIELMGRSCPDLTVRSAIATNSTYAVTKYTKLNFEGFMKIVNDSLAKGKYNINILVTEKLYDQTGPRSLSEIAKRIEKETKLMCRHIPVGYIQRGGKPSARDRLLANYMTSIAVEAIAEGRRNRAICRLNRTTVDIDLAKALQSKRKSWNRGLVSIFNKINQQ